MQGIARLLYRYVEPDRWQYRRIQHAGHWIPRDAPDALNALLLDFLTPKAAL